MLEITLELLEKNLPILEPDQDCWIVYGQLHQPVALRISDACFVPRSHNISRGGGPDAPQTTDAGRELNGGSATVMSECSNRRLGLWLFADV